MKSNKCLFSPERNKFWTWICVRKTVKADNVKKTFPRIYLVSFFSSKLAHFLKFSFREKRDLNFVLIDKWNVNNSIEKVEVYFYIMFYEED